MIWLERDDMIIHTHNNYHSCTIRILVYLALYYTMYTMDTKQKRKNNKRTGVAMYILVLILTCDDER